MNDGLWIVEFTSSVGLSGTGILVISGERLLGGDIGYYYSGQCKVEGEKLQGSVNVIRFDQNTLSVFGDEENFTLQLDGIIRGDVFEANATSDKYPKHAIAISGKKKENF